VPDRLVVVAVADEDDRVPLLGEAEDLEVTLVTSGQVASTSTSRARLDCRRTSGEMPWAL
jgi:hypothetical protein